MNGDAPIGSLEQLVRSIESRLTGSMMAQYPVDSLIPEADSYVLFLFDGLGSHQLNHQDARTLSAARKADLVAPFPTTTTVSLSTIATGRAPAEHGVIAHLMWLPKVQKVVNTLKWVDVTGAAVKYDTSSFLSSPNTWERLRKAGIEPITVQPGGYANSPMTRMLYRGCRFEAVWDATEMMEATVQLVTEPGRLVFTYLPNVDVSAHVHGQTSSEYAEALSIADSLWGSVVARLPSGVRAIGTADHGHVDYTAADKLIIRDPSFNELRLWGDARAVFASGSPDLIAHLADVTGADVADTEAVRELLGPTDHPHPDLEQRLPHAVLFAPQGKVLLPRGFDKRLTGYHGGATPPERHIPLLIG